MLKAEEDEDEEEEKERGDVLDYLGITILY